MEETPKLRVVKKRTDPDTILVRCEQCGRWTPVEVNIKDLQVEIVGFKTSYKTVVQ